MAPAAPLVYTGHKESKGCSSQQKKINHNHNSNSNITSVGDKMSGKSRKFPIGGLPDYRHAAVEITAESEGFGSSGRVDTEMTLSEDSCSPKRKCISLNGDSHDRFGVPLQVLSYSKMNKLERRELEVRLKKELEEVRIMQRRVASFSTSAVVLSPSSDIRSCSDGQKRPPLESVKKRVPPQGKNGPRSKKVPPGGPPLRQAVSMSNVAPPSPMVMKQCENLLSRLMGHQYGWVFNAPVDVEKLNIPDYYTVIKHPMDLGTIKNKLSRGEYSSPFEFAADVRLTFSNAMTYNPVGNDVHIMAQTLSKHFEQRWKPIEKKLPANTDAQVVPSRIEPQVQNGRAVDPGPPAKKKKVAPPPMVGHVGKVEPVVKRVMSVEDKHKLSTELEALLADLPESIVNFLKENSSGAQQTSEDEIEIDIDALSDEVLFKLRKLLDDFVSEKKKHQSKAEPCEMELHNESGFSNSSIQPGKGNDAADEDVDIGGNDHPVSSFPPVEIEKDAANKNSRCSSPSSSSSDSDSDSSSSSESEGQKALPRPNKSQGNTNAESKLDRSHSDVDHDVGRTQSQNGMGQVEQNQPTKPLSSVEEDGLKEGESTPSERQVSPDKLYRAALLRSRFADTILKAQEKTLEKGEKRDPEKLRLEREELERRQREEKARLQAEAKAAEEARRKAEAEAAAEAKRKREQEREAARLALQKMEKTVEINENCQFMEDLEMLTAAPADNLSSFIDDGGSPHDSQNGGCLGSFRFRANSNPLEQLGLYMKDDGEDDEEVDNAPQSQSQSQSQSAAVPDMGPPPPPPTNDVEEGEID